MLLWSARSGEPMVADLIIDMVVWVGHAIVLLVLFGQYEKELGATPSLALEGFDVENRACSAAHDVVSFIRQMGDIWRIQISL